jgi:hypothetical protein
MDNTGPFLTAAAICERVLQERDGVLSAIRIVDRITLTAAGEVPEHLPEFPPHNLTVLVSFKSGNARGRHTVSFRVEKPSGEEGPALGEFPVLFEGGERGVNLGLLAVWG